MKGTGKTTQSSIIRSIGNYQINGEIYILCSGNGSSRMFISYYYLDIFRLSDLINKKNSGNFRKRFYFELKNF